jgi:hypothetical protein
MGIRFAAGRTALLLHATMHRAATLQTLLAKLVMLERTNDLQQENLQTWMSPSTEVRGGNSNLLDKDPPQSGVAK